VYTAGYSVVKLLAFNFAYWLPLTFPVI